MSAKEKAVKEAPAVKEISFEQALKRLEEIVDKIEQGKVNLHDVMKMYEEGVHLSKNCLDQLSRAESKLKRLGKDMDGNVTLLEDERDE